jgi:hypothetical protein
MGRTISIYLDDKFVNILKSQDKSVSGIVKEALDLYFKTSERRKSFYQVMENAEKIGMSEAFKKAEREWLKNRESDRW